MEEIAREMFNLPGALVGYYINLIVGANSEETMVKVAKAVDALQKREKVDPNSWIGIELFPYGIIFFSALKIIDKYLLNSHSTLRKSDTTIVAKIRLFYIFAKGKFDKFGLIFIKHFVGL